MRRADTIVVLDDGRITERGTHDERPVLGNLDLVLPAGATVAVVEENGAGKTMAAAGYR